ncbi:MAG: heavy metal translocating P-type ATPase [Myxococcota bacterium]|nr:heavy metal translocating P-type ATPase [Myxococcota bacterium]
MALKVHGMDCAEEVGTLKRVLKDLVDPDALVFDTLSGVMEVPENVDMEAVISAVGRTGMRAVRVQGDSPEPDPSVWERNRTSILATVSGMGVAAGFGLHAVLGGLEAAIGHEGMGGAEHAVPVPALVAYGMGVAAGLWPVLPKAWFSLRSLRPDMNLLMTLAVTGAIAIGEWFEAGTVAFLFAVSLALESWSVGRARKAVERLLSLAPDTVRVKEGDATREVPPSEVAVGTSFVVRPGERIGLDGLVATGRSEVDQAPITGESVLAAKEPGDEVFAGTINGNGVLEVRSTAAATDTTLARIVAMVGEARKDRSESERWVERFARIYTPVVFGAAALVFVVPPLAFGADWGTWFYRALVLLVIGCPCALVISTPVAVVSGLAAAARNGVLVKGGRFLEIPAHLAVVAVDKTGTLTLGRPELVDIHALDDHTPERLLAVAAAIEADSEHPIARAVVDRAAGGGSLRASSVEAVPGKGARGVVDGRAYWLGSHRWLEERGQETPELHALLEAESARGRTVVAIGTDDHVCGTLSLADTIKPEARASIAALHDAGVARVAMLTGDNRGTAAAVAAEVGIDDVRAELLPADKVSAVEELERTYGPVAMIGDGVNDAPALARSAIGVAMGAIGTDVAVETADVALMTDDLAKLAWLVRHSRRTLSIVRQNTVFALAIKALFVVLTFAGLASLWGAIAADMGASLLVVFNALRLLRSEAE